MDSVATSYGKLHEIYVLQLCVACSYAPTIKVSDRMNNYFLLIVLTVITLRVSAQDLQYQDPQNMPVKPTNTDCQELPETFRDLSEAISAIQNTRFHYDQKIKTTRKSGLMQVRFVSCDFKKGFLMVRYDGEDQVYPNIELQLWEQFQQSADIDGFYFENIEHLKTIAYK